MERMFAAYKPVEPGEGFAAIHFEGGIGEGITLKEVFCEYCNQAR